MSNPSKFKNALASAGLSLTMLVMAPRAAFAVLPVVEPPTRGEGAGIIETIQNYAYDIAILVGLAICAIAFLAVAWYSMAVYADVQNSRKTWRDLGAVVLIGALLVVAIIWFLTKASEIL